MNAQGGKYGSALQAAAYSSHLRVVLLLLSSNALEVKHIGVLKTLASLGANLRNQGQWKEAEELEIRIMETMKKVLGPDHPSTLASMANLVLIYRSQERWEEAEELSTKVVEVMKRALGPNHPSTLTNMANLASIYQSRERWEEAEELSIKVVEAMKKVLGPNHPSTLTNMANLASIYRSQERWEKAEELSIKVMEAMKRVLGPDHPSTLTNMANLASIYQSRERWEEAEELSTKVVERMKSVLGLDHPSTLTNMANLASIYRSRERWEEAEELSTKVVEAMKRVLGPDHPSTLTNIASLASIYRSRERWEEAEELSTKVVEPMNRTAQHQERAMEGLKDALIAQKPVETVPEEHPDRILHLRTLAAQLTSRYERTGSIADLENAISVTQDVVNIMPEDYPNQAGLLSNLGAQLESRYARTGAIEDLKRAIDVTQEAVDIIPKNHPDRAEILNNLSAQLKSRYERTGAIEDLERAIAVTQEAVDIIPEDHPDRATYLNNLGTQLRLRFESTRDMQDLAQATQRLQEAVVTVPKDHPYRAGILNNLSDQLILTYRSTGAREDLELSRLPYAAEATFSARGKQHDPLCLLGTRVDVLMQIRAWADEPQNARIIFWLNGLAGTGKSTIARTVACEYYNQNRLAASFFFSRGSGDTSHAGKFCTSIAVQLAHLSLVLKRHICEAIADHRDIANQSLRQQWNQLVLRPLSKLNDDFPRPLILVVDALDECDEHDVQVIVQLFAEVRSFKTVPLRIFMTSRPELSIRYSFGRMPDTEYQELILHQIPHSTVDYDISLFLEYNFQLIRRERALPADWPGGEAIRNLVWKSSGLFIWAATACRFVREGRRFAMKRLSMILQGNTPISAPEKRLDEIYLTVLENSVPNEYDAQEKEEMYSILRKVLGAIVILFSPISLDSLAELLLVPKEEVDQALEELHGVLDIPENDSHPIRLHHPSFRDFLLSKDRCGDPHFWVDEKQAHRALANNCIQLTSGALKRNICGLDAPGTLIGDVDSSRVKMCIPLEIQYACLYWVHHLQRSGAQLCDNDQVHQFLREHFLHWLETLSLINKTSEGVLAVTSLASHTPVSYINTWIANCH